MQVSVAHYELVYSKGALLRTESDWGVGFADLHPWPQLGDPSLEQMLVEIEQGHVQIPQLRLALAFSVVDAQARARKLALLESFSQQNWQSHWLCRTPQQLSLSNIKNAAAEGFTTVKVKWSPQAQRELIRELVNLVAEFDGQLKWRLDFNAGWTSEEVNLFLQVWPKQLRTSIEFIEDPMPAKTSWPESWCLWAADRCRPDNKPAIEVIKPEVDVGVRGGRKIVTNNLGHPVGHMQTLWWLQQKFSNDNLVLADVHGLQGADQNSWLRYQGPKVAVTLGEGWGDLGEVATAKFKRVGQLPALISPEEILGVAL